MKHPQVHFFLILLIFLSSCSPKVTTVSYFDLEALEHTEEVTVIDIHHLPPDESVIIGKIKIGDSGFTNNCAYIVVIEYAKLEARKQGGNALKITSHKFPSILGSTCHRIEADVLFVENTNLLKEENLIKRPPFQAVTKSLRGQDIIYRTNGKQIFCVISSEDDDIVYFSILVNDAPVNTQLAKSQIKEIIYANE